MAVSFDALDESKFFKFVIISDKPKPSKNNFTEKPPKDKELRDNNMSTSSSSPPPSNEKLDEKNQDNQNSQVANKLPEVKVDDSPNNNGDSTKEPKEQENEEKSSRLTIKVPSKSSSPQLVASPSELRAKTPEPVSPSQGSNFFKKLGNMIRSTSDNGTAPEQEEAATSDSKDQVQQEQQEQQVQQVQQEQQEQQEQPVANDNITENTVNTARSIDENKKEGEDKKNTPEPTPVKQRTNSLANLVNTKMFITRTSSLLKEVFDSIDRKMYPDMEPDWVAENQNKLNREAAISEREQLLENKDVEITNDKSQNPQSPQSPQSTKNVMADVGVALNERKEKLENLGERTEELSNHAADFANLAKQLSERQEQKSKWFW